MATYAELITDYENRRKAAERKVSDSKARAKNYVDALDAAGLEKMTPEQDQMAESLLAKHRAAIDEVKRAEGALKALRDAQAEDAEADRLSRQVHSTGVELPEGDRVTRAGDSSVSVDSGAHGGPIWRYADTGKPAAVERGRRFADHEAAREYAERFAERDRVLVGTHGGIAQQIRALSTSGASAVVPTQWSFPIIDKVRNAAVVFQAGATSVPMPAKVVQIGRLTTDVFAGDFSQVLIGERMSLEVRVLTERYAELGQVEILAYWRGDVQVARPKALAVYRALQGAA